MSSAWNPLNWSAATWKAARTSAFLSLLFLVIYGFCNRYTATRDDVHVFFFEWERLIPFVPLMIVPYMSIDLFFVAAPFLCSDERERKTFSRRITFVILVAAACFLLFPMRFAFERPYVEGPLGLIFNNFRLLDLPYNEFPSLHIALRTVLAHLYVRHTRGAVRWLARVWFVLVGLSTLLTYQHHVIDIVGGFVLGSMCFYFIPEAKCDSHAEPNPGIGVFYLAGAVFLAALAWWFSRWALFLLWPAASLGVVGCAYFRHGAGPAVFRKKDGNIPPSAWLVCWPVLAGQWLSMKYYATQSRAWDAVDERVWIGRQLSETEARGAVEQGVHAVLDLTCEFSEAPAFKAQNYLQLSVLDLTAPTPEQLDRACEFIREASRQGIVYVHCKAGYSRSAAVAAAYLIATGQAGSADDAIAKLRAVRPAIVIRPEVDRAIRGFAKSRGAVTTPS